jgi:DNA recombination protein RmuC
MDIALISICILGGAAVSAFAVWLWRGQRIAVLAAENAAFRRAVEDAQLARAELENAKGKLEAAKRDSEELIEARRRIFDLGRDAATLRAKLDAAVTAHDEQVQQLTRLRQEVQDQFKLLAGDVLRTTSDDFIKRADDIFTKQKELTAKEIDERTKVIDDLIKPLGLSLLAYDAELKKIEKARIEGFSAIETTLKSVSSQHDEVKSVTANLVNALRASPKTRGRWGEETLRRVMELSGMVEHCDFETEKHFRGDDESLRPDVLINVSGSRVIVVDAKAPVSAYLDAISATGDEERELLLKRHASQLRERLVSLSSKSYWEKIQGSLDCVVMFVPGENFVSAAFERDPDLFEDAIKSRVLICTPTTFIGLAKALSFGWRQQRLAQNASDIARLGKDLYSRLATMGSHIAKLSGSLKSSVDQFNRFIGSMESSVMPQARKFQELGVEGAVEALPEFASVDLVVRLPQEGRDLLISSEIEQRDEA